MAADWPADSGLEIGQVGEPDGLPEDYEPSGAVWHPLRQTLIVVDDSGRVSELGPYGNDVTTWVVENDLEGVTIADPDNDLVYLAVEQPDAVLEFDLATGTLTGNQWDLTPWLQGPSNHGLEALTYVDGHFYAGLQEDGNIFVFDLLDGGTVQYLDTIAPHAGRDDISGLHYDVCTGILYAIHDSHDVIVEMSADGSFLREYDLAGDSQEGIALIGGSTSGQTTIFIAEDAGAVWRYEQYPVAYCSPPTSVGGIMSHGPDRLSCSPNPFNPSTELSFELLAFGHVTLSIIDLRGQHVRVIVDGFLQAGEHRVNWDGCSDDGSRLSSSVYFARVESGEHHGTAKLVLVR
ncbi:SdiA-regulated domain-containing protein [bacterium]|nr:SdiA-regulated domain-containing protein [bacterium]